MAETCDTHGVNWLEEPASSDDLARLRRLRDRMPPSIDVAAAGYAWNLDDVGRMLEAGAVDVQQAGASRCGGVTESLAAATPCEAHHLDLSGHCAPSPRCHMACAAPRLRHLGYFHDRVRVAMLSGGARDGMIAPGLSRPGQELALKAADAARYAL